APQSPGRADAAARLLEIPTAFDEVAHLRVDAEPAAMLTRAGGVGAQCAALHHHRAFQFDALDRAVAHVALTDGDRAGLAVLERPSAPAAALNALHHET